MLNSVIFILLLLCCSAFFSASETALFSLSQIQLHHFKESHKRSKRMIASALEAPRKVLITILLGNELVNVSISILSAILIAKIFARGAIVETIISVILVTPLVLIFGEVIPKNLALRFSKQYSEFAIFPLRTFSVAVKPIRWFLTAIADFFIKLLGGTVSEQPMVMEQEYRQLIDLGRREGLIIEEERELIHNIFDFSDKTVESIMTPAEDIVSLPLGLHYEEILQKIKHSGFSRIPFYENDPDNIVGTLHIRDLFAFDRKRSAGGEQDIGSILIRPLFVAPNHKLEDLLREFQNKRIHIAVVKRHNGKIAGLVTMDDVLEDLFGEMKD